ncbi:unnamed protein product [Acanthoscelides obtectus]|uniref:Uncharacterized protein n=1 Tax=Acanthoscelides obtectus TaxID=200917 RepID=A0A9P0JLJ3_ACAOB|nr:unnamed protein product [Acanthoscelides obtectus]CAK1654308.1 hypothetical protein AOBTE_LOCUS18516 [Acanthoscelides obtectus]
MKRNRHSPPDSTKSVADDLRNE